MERFGPTRRGGPVFRWLGLPLAIDLANTVIVVRHGEVVDLLATQQDLERWLAREQERLGDCAFAVAHLEEIRALRDAVRGLLVASARGATHEPTAIERVNAASGAAPMAPQLETAGDCLLQTVERAVNGDPLAQLLGTLARSAIAVLTGPESRRLQVCGAPSCGMVFVSGRRWCSAPCGNRARAARHYQRMRGPAAD
jgi:predicted RNA-binding Zn ribbon-like protein